MLLKVSGISRAAMVALACASLAACGGGGAGGGSATADSGTQAPAAQAIDPIAQEADAVRLAKQATFGPNMEVVNRILAVGTRAWIDEQLEATGSTYADLVAGAVPRGTCTAGDTTCTVLYFSREQVAMRFYANALSKPDQLRQRVALALSQLVTATEVGNSIGAGLASLNQIYLENAFGNYRDILMGATMSTFMGEFLNMVDSNKTAPSENYAREMLQLFSMGPDKLNLDGTVITDASGGAVPNYTPDDIRGVARALTGWTYARFPSSPINDTRDWSKPMVMNPAKYDTTAKTFFGVTVPAGASQTDSVAAVVDAAFNNPSTPPFVAKFLIRHLVTANPSPAYVARVAGAFVNNGQNVRGDMKAVVRAILTDVEARAVPSGDSVGKVKEPILMMTALARVEGMVSDGYMFTVRDVYLGQPVFSAPSVFSFYPQDNPLPKSSTLVSPASKLMMTPQILQRHNMIYDWTISALNPRSEWAPYTNFPMATGSSVDWSAWEALDIDGQINRIDLLMLGRTMTAAQKTALRNAANAITNTVPAMQSRARAQAMIYIVATSPLFQVDR